jgi:hypothetical protein
MTWHFMKRHGLFASLDRRKVVGFEKCCHHGDLLMYLKGPLDTALQQIQIEMKVKWREHSMHGEDGEH